jgi:hypothetical protein
VSIDQLCVSVFRRSTSAASKMMYSLSASPARNAPPVSSPSTKPSARAPAFCDDHRISPDNLRQQPIRLSFLLVAPSTSATYYLHYDIQYMTARTTETQIIVITIE